MSEDTASAIATDIEVSKNDEIKKALLSYCRFPYGQGFAVLVNGAWGSGKTRFIKSLSNHFSAQRPGETPRGPLYVSLYGVGSTTEIDELLFQQLHPILSHKATRLAGAVLKGIGKFSLKVDLGQIGQLTGALPDVNLTSMLSGADGRVVIFDDFERALLDPMAILGYINPFVEHENCKVIIIADESQIKDETKREYERRKEKTIGQTFEFVPDVSSALAAFLKEIDRKDARSFLEKSQDLIFQLFADSTLQNLRILKQLLWDFERLWAALTPTQQENEAAMRELLSVVCVAAFELRSGRLQEKDFMFVNGTRRVLRHMRRKESAPEPMEQIEAQYPNVSFSTALLEADTICDCVLRSKVSLSKVQSEIAKHPHFSAKDSSVNVPAESWRALWYAFELPYGMHDRLIAAFDKDFENRKFDDPIVIYHVIGLALWLSSLQFPHWNEADVELKIKQYIDDVYTRREATVDEASQDESIDANLGGYGLGFRCSENPKFEQFVSYEKAQRDAWRKRSYPAIAAVLEELAKNNSKLFLRQVCFTNAGPSTYARVGVLSKIPSDRLAEIIASSSYHDQREIMMAISLRYEQVTAYKELQEELQWLSDMQTRLLQLAEGMPPITKEAFLNLERHYLNAAIKKSAHLVAAGSE